MMTRRVNDRWDLIVPDHVAAWDAPSDYERARFASMEANLRNGMILYDIGAEHGWVSALYARFVGAGNMVLVEPTPEMWPNIRRTWEANGLGAPRGSWVGFAADADAYTRASLGALTGGGRWPDVADGPEQPAHPYRYLDVPADTAVTPAIKLDTLYRWVARPSALTIDAEGAELLVLRGAAWVLSQARPLVWVSIHPELMATRHGHSRAGVLAYMTASGYAGQHLATDWEEHWLFWPKERKGVILTPPNQGDTHHDL